MANYLFKCGVIFLFLLFKLLSLSIITVQCENHQLHYHHNHHHHHHYHHQHQNRQQSRDKKCEISINNGQLVLVGKFVQRPPNMKYGYCAYLGIPYAKPPIGPLRFESTQEKPLFGTSNSNIPPTGRKYFTKEANVCLQLSQSYMKGTDNIKFVGSENCLYLNVYVKKTPSQHMKPPSAAPININNSSQKNNTSFTTTTETSPATTTDSIENTSDSLFQNTPENPQKNVNRNSKKNSTIKLFVSSTSKTIPTTKTTTTTTTNIVGLMPVILWIHGGSFYLGSANSDTNGPDYLVEKDVIVVTINYRLGPFGFISQPKYNLTGNYGLEDQQMAMHWIKKYIHLFGGNSSQVTLMGWSAGAASISYHLYAQSSANLFHRAIMMSGNMLNPWAFNENAYKCANALVKRIGFNYDDELKPDLKNLLKLVRARKFIRKSQYFRYFGSPEYCYTPTLNDGYFYNQYRPPFNTPAKLINKFKPITKIPLLIGYTSLEIQLDLTNKYQSDNVYFPNRNRTYLRLIENMLDNFFNQSQTNLIGKSCGDDDSNKSVNTLLNDIAEMKKMFEQKFRPLVDEIYGINNFVNSYTNMTREKVFLYRFSYDGKFGNFKKESKTDAAGAIHGDDLGYLFRDFLVNDNNNSDASSIVNMNSSDISYGSNKHDRNSKINGSGSGGDNENDDDDDDDGNDNNNVQSDGYIGHNMKEDKIVDGLTIRKEKCCDNVAGSGGDDYDVDVEYQQQYNEMDLKNEILMRKRMVEMWTNFVKFGDPTPRTNNILTVKWPSYNNKNNNNNLNYNNNNNKIRDTDDKNKLTKKNDNNGVAKNSKGDSDKDCDDNTDDKNEENMGTEDDGVAGDDGFGQPMLLNINLTMSVEPVYSHDDISVAVFQLWDSIHKCLYNKLCQQLDEYLFNNKSIL